MALTAQKKLLEVPLPIKLDKLTEILRIQGTPVYVHWSVWLIVVLIMVNVVRRPIQSLLALTAYLGVLLIHETGHLVAARKMHCEVHEIRLYPIFGVTKFQTPWSKMDHCVIAWGGVIAQAIVAIPIITAVTIFGYSGFEPFNTVLAILGFFSIGVAIFNLLPVRPLDGSIAWAIIPEAFRRFRSRGGTGRRTLKY
jgi:Zn-dependent protease